MRRSEVPQASSDIGTHRLFCYGERAVTLRSGTIHPAGASLLRLESRARIGVVDILGIELECMRSRFGKSDPGHLGVVETTQ